jgi:hypothetical protein
MVGKTVKSKINGDLFQIDELKVESNKEYYVVKHIASGKKSNILKGWFEKGYMQNMEIV